MARHGESMTFADDRCEHPPPPTPPGASRQWPATHSGGRQAAGERSHLAAGGEEGAVATWPKVMAPPRCVWHSSHAHFGPTCKRLWQSRRHPPVMRPTSIESRNTDLTGIVLNSDALWGHSCFKIHLPVHGVRAPAHAPGSVRIITRLPPRVGVRYTDSTHRVRPRRGLGCRTQSYYRKTHRRHSHRRPSVSSLATPLHLSLPKPPPRSGSTPCHDM